MWNGGSALGIVQRGRDEDGPREDQGERREPERKGRSDPKGVVDARADVAVGGGEKGRRPQRARELGSTPDHDA